MAAIESAAYPEPGEGDRAAPGEEDSEERPDRADDFIAQNLQRLFTDLENEPMPDRLKALLDRLAQDEAEGEGGAPRDPSPR